MVIVIDVRIVSYIRYSSILFKLDVIIIGCIHIRIHGCQVHRCHSIIIIVNRQLSSLKLKRKEIGLTLMETIDE